MISIVPAGASVGVRRSDLDPVAALRPTDGRVVYAVGPIHGRYDLFAALLEAIVDDAAAQPAGAAPLLILCGDHIDRGPASDAVLAGLVWLWRHAALDVRFLRGEHEAALLDFVDDPRTLPAWLAIGGATTLRAYGIDPDGSPRAHAALRDTLLDRMPASHLALLRAMPTGTACGGYLFGRPAPRAEVTTQGRDDRDRTPVAVDGHGGGAAEPEVTRDRIGIDTGAWTTGVLTALRLDGATAVLLQTGGAAPPDPVTDRAPDRVVADTPDDEDDGGGSASLRAALSKLRPGF
ncbi:metallophosphoesterase [Sphingomonas sp. Leaf412]|uniref:metallophosphoesterase n=1 Tax=Sphingomonas sp. Leaf412 TaxID=1736370 RepID=UPI000A81023A|nr:metallophosphoesterase [Sphingomonas sp. Leaf412]